MKNTLGKAGGCEGMVMDRLTGFARARLLPVDLFVAPSYGLGILRDDIHIVQRQHARENGQTRAGGCLTSLQLPPP